MRQPIEAVMVGAGNRGHFAYGGWARRHPDQIRFVAVAEPDAERRRRFAAAHRIPAERCFNGWEELHARGRLAEALFNCTLDGQHLASTLPALALGYDVMLEKPMAPDLAGNLQLVAAAARHGARLTVGHVLRYTAFFSLLHDLVGSGGLGELVALEQRENIAFWHMAHSFVRGSWRRGVDCPMILAKCCHDLDLLYWNAGPVRRLSSLGSLMHFRPERAPHGAPARCTDGCPAADDCPHYAPRLYLGWYVGWPVNVISVALDRASRRRALERGPYGRCVYRCDNDVVDHQTVSMEFASGATGVLVMQGHAHAEERTVRLDGTRATLRGRFRKGSRGSIEVHDHRTGRTARYRPRVGWDGHGGGDAGIMEAFVRTVRAPGGDGLTSGRESLVSHLLAFAAEESRREGTVIDFPAYERRALAEAAP